MHKVPESSKLQRWFDAALLKNLLLHNIIIATAGFAGKRAGRAL